MARRTRIGLGLGIAAMAGVLGVAALWRPAADEAAPSGARGAPTPPPPDRWSGVAWTEVESPVFADPAYVFGIATDGELLVAWGEAHPRDAATGASGDAAPLWRTADGEAWTRSDLVDAGGAPMWMRALAMGNGEWLAVRGDNERAPLWTSPDGDTWTAVEGGTPSVQHLVPVGGGFVAVATDDARPGLVALQIADGRVSPPVRLPGPQEAYVSAVATTDRKVLAVGTAMGEPDQDGLIWRGDADGWTLTGPGHDVFGAPDVSVGLHQVLPFFGGIYVLGTEGAIPVCGHRAPVLVAGPVLADVCPGNPPAAWVSDDGETWRKGDVPRPAGVRDGYVEGVIAGGDGLLALAHEADLEGARRPPSLWTSGDGETWRRIGDGPPDTGHLALLRGRLIVVGHGPDERPRVWVGTPVRG